MQTGWEKNCSVRRRIGHAPFSLVSKKKFNQNLADVDCVCKICGPHDTVQIYNGHVWMIPHPDNVFMFAVNYY